MIARLDLWEERGKIDYVRSVRNRAQEGREGNGRTAVHSGSYVYGNETSTMVGGGRSKESGFLGKPGCGAGAVYVRGFQPGWVDG